MSKKIPIHILILISLIALPACGREVDVGYDPTNTPIPPEPSQLPTHTPLPATPTPTPWPFKPESLGIRLGSYIENLDGSLDFWVYVLNPNPGMVIDCAVSVILYDGDNNQLIDNQESCGGLDAYSENWVIVEFDESFIPEDYQAYNIYAQAVAPGGKLLEGELNNLPVTGQEGVELSITRVLPEFAVELDWIQPQGDYLPGDKIEVQMITRLLQGQLDESILCLQVAENRAWGNDTTSLAILADSCQTVTWKTGEDQQTITLDFQPSGYTWIEKKGTDGNYVPLEIAARGEVLLRGIKLAENEKELYLPPVKVDGVSWSADGLEVNTVQPETPYQVELKLKSLTDDPMTHSIQLSIRYTEHDPEEWLVSGLLLFIPCLFGFCEDEAVVYTQEDQVTLTAGAEYQYSIPVLLPEGPTAEVGIGGYYYLALSFDGVTIWRGSKVPLEIPETE
jgi:hypothetical protein